MSATAKSKLVRRKDDKSEHRRDDDKEKEENDDDDEEEEEDEHDEDAEHEEEDEKPQPKAKAVVKKAVVNERKTDILEAGVKDIRLKSLSQILPYLYLGDADAAQQKDELKRLRITNILNCASQDVEDAHKDDFKCTDLPIPSDDDANIAEYFDQVYDLIADVRDSKQLLLVHDIDGKNIAPALVLAYMMMSAKKQDKHLSLLQAIKFIDAKHIGMKLSDHIAEQLLEKEIELYEVASIQIPKRKKKNAEKIQKQRGGTGGKGKRGK